MLSCYSGYTRALRVPVSHVCGLLLAELRKFILTKNKLHDRTVVRLNGNDCAQLLAALAGCPSYLYRLIVGTLDPAFLHALRVKELSDVDMRYVELSPVACRHHVVSACSDAINIKCAVLDCWPCQTTPSDPSTVISLCRTSCVFIYRCSRVRRCINLACFVILLSILRSSAHTPPA